MMKLLERFIEKNYKKTNQQEFMIEIKKKQIITQKLLKLKRNLLILIMINISQLQSLIL